MIYTLTACFGMFLGMCGQIVVIEFKDLPSCEKALSSMEKSKSYIYGYCKEKVSK